MNFKIRPAQIEDKDKILSVIGSHPFKWDKRIAKRYYDDYFSNKNIYLKGDIVYVGTIDDKVIGVIGYSLDRYETKNYWLGWFYVHKNYKGEGYGKELLGFVVKKLKSKGVKKIFVNTSSHYFYQNALTLYIDNGFRVETVIRNYYGKNEDQIILAKKI